MSRGIRNITDDNESLLISKSSRPSGPWQGNQSRMTNENEPFLKLQDPHSVNLQSSLNGGETSPRSPFQEKGPVNKAMMNSLNSSTHTEELGAIEGDR